MLWPGLAASGAAHRHVARRSLLFAWLFFGGLTGPIIAGVFVLTDSAALAVLALLDGMAFRAYVVREVAHGVTLSLFACRRQRGGGGSQGVRAKGGSGMGLWRRNTRRNCIHHAGAVVHVFLAMRRSPGESGMWERAYLYGFSGK